MPAGGRAIVNEAELHKLLHSPVGPLARRLEADAEIVAQEQKRLCPVSPVGESDHPSGQLRSSIGWELHSEPEGLVATIGVDERSPAAEYALAVELGTKPHVIESHGDYPLRNQKGQVFGRRVEHPGTEAQPYLRPSLDALPPR